MKKKNYLLLLVLFLFCPVIAQRPDAVGTKTRTVHLDKKGVIRWDNNEEVALFGANYCLPSACDYRAAGYVTNDRKKMIDQDMTHFARMGWDGLRICLWGDYENSDKNGNLVNNDHLDLMDYLIFKAKERGIYMLFTPITTYSSQWPDAMRDTVSARGFSTRFKKSELGINPEAIRVQVNYLQQILNHVNPYTGIAIKDEPFILFIEMINEPWHHSADFEGSVNYINALVDAVRSTGCKKILFHNVSQDMKMASAIKASKVDGASFAWYPMGLVSGHRLKENHLRATDDFTPMHTPELTGIPRIVYEFDEADSYTPYMYPAMVRAFRGAGAQFASMFSYDMLATAPYNLGWQTHLMNMVYYPQKTVAAVIAAEIMKQVPMYQNYGKYPDNTTFGPFRVSYEENLSEMTTLDKFIYSNNTATKPSEISTLKKIVGYGSSSVVNYPGRGIYFLDKIKEGVWRLEVYPDALLIADPFEQPSPDKTVCRLIGREWPMKIDLPDLGKAFFVIPVNSNNTFSTRAENGKMTIKPGVYLLSADDEVAPGSIPEKIGNLMFDEYICPEPMDILTSINIIAHPEYTAGNPVTIKAEVIDVQTPVDVSMYYRSVKFRNWFHKVPMICTEGYTYEASIPEDQISEGLYKYCIAVTSDNKTISYPASINKTPWDWDFYTHDFWQFSVINKRAPLTLLNPEKDVEYLFFTRIGDAGRQGIYDVLPGADQGQSAIRLYFPLKIDKSLNDYSMSIAVKEKIKSRNETLDSATGINIRARGNLMGQTAYITLMESDGTSWSTTIDITETWEDLYIPFKNLQVSKGVLLPQGFPEQWNYWVSPANGRGGEGDRIKTAKIERVQLSIRPSGTVVPDKNPWMDVSLINISFN
jgi:hypothetical protein